MTTEKLNGTVYEVHSFVVALPCGHIDTLEVRVREVDPDREDYLADCIAATEAGKNAALPVCRRCFAARPQGVDVSEDGTYIVGGQKMTITGYRSKGGVITGGHFVPTPQSATNGGSVTIQVGPYIADFLTWKGRP